MEANHAFFWSGYKLKNNLSQNVEGAGELDRSDCVNGQQPVRVPQVWVWGEGSLLCQGSLQVKAVGNVQVCHEAKSWKLRV